MNHTALVYIIFGIVLLAALSLDLGFVNKKGKEITSKQAAVQTIFWVGLSVLFWLFIWYESGGVAATKYIGAYLMEWSLSIDNIFVFVLIFSSFKIKKKDIGLTLLIGVLLAIIFRIIFIAAGIGLIDRFHWILYVFGFFLLYTGIKLFFQKNSHGKEPAEGKFFQWIKKHLSFTDEEPHGKYVINKNGKRFYTVLALVVIVLAGTDIAFALDSIPTVVSLVKESPDAPFTSSDIIIIYSSNIFAVLGLRSMFFLLQGAANRFRYLQRGIAVILVFIGIKMLLEIFHISVSIGISLGVIVLCVGASILLSVMKRKV